MTSQTAHGQPDNENTMMHQTNSAFRGAFFMGGSMIKRFFLALLLAAGLLSPALGAGTITISLTQRLDNSSHLPLSGGKIYFIQAGTTATPQNAFQDSALTLPYANPLILDSGGNIPQLFFADGVIKVRITNSVGIQQIVQDNIQVTGASSGGGGGGTVDPTTILSPCDMKVVYGTGTLTGFVRMNGRTIGNAVSGATERANADTLAAFTCLYNNDNNLVVSGGRVAGAAADYAAGKTIATPDYRGRALAGLDDMGNTAASRLTSTYFGTAATVLGAAGGTESRTLSLAQLPTGITSSGSTSNAISVVSTTSDVIHSAGMTTTGGQGGGTFTAVSVGFGIPTPSTVASTNPSQAISASVTSNNTSGSAHATASPMMLATIYLKL